ncbi:DNA repair protein RadC [Aerococcaceae bacterium NML191219]|nr:DNA repair protein RadC [Aerococcaceae bacterium NML191219]
MEIKKILSEKCQPSIKDLNTAEIMNPNFYLFNALMTPKDKKLLDSINRVIKEYTFDMIKSRPVISSTKMAKEYFQVILKNEAQEKVLVAFLGSKNQVLDVKTIFIGTVNSAMTHPREIFREAIKFPTARIILAHNHPSGDVTPSEEDLRFTRKMIECGELMGIELLDHIIVGNNRICSLRDETYLW